MTETLIFTVLIGAIAVFAMTIDVFKLHAEIRDLRKRIVELENSG